VLPYKLSTLLLKTKLSKDEISAAPFGKKKELDNLKETILVIPVCG